MFSHFDDDLISKIKREIKKVITKEQYKKIDESILDDYAKMIASLRNASVTEIVECFAELSRELESRYKALGLLKETNTDGSISKSIENSKIPHHAVFTTTIEEWAKRYGLNQGGKAHCMVSENNKQARRLIDLPGTIPVIFGTLSPSVFRGLLSMGYLFKDVGAGKEHGEFTHILALYFLIEMNNKKPFLTHHPADLYKMLGNECCYNPKDTTGMVGIWDLIFDYQDDNANNAPIAFNRLLREDLGKHESTQVLASVIQKRYSKRELAEKNNESLAQKFKNTPGLLLDEKIFFNLPFETAQIKASYDEVVDACTYELTMSSQFTLPNMNIDKGKSIFENLIDIIHASLSLPGISLDLKTKQLIAELEARLQRLKIQAGNHDNVPHRLLAEMLQDLLNPDFTFTYNKKTRTSEFVKQESEFFTNPYLHSLINQLKKILIEEDTKEISNSNSNTMTQSTQIVEIATRLRK